MIVLRRLFASLVLLLVIQNVALAQEAGKEPGQPIAQPVGQPVAPLKHKESVSEKSMNPLSTMISVPFENNTLFNLGPSNVTANVLNIKPVFPIQLKNWNLINRISVPVIYTQGQSRGVDIPDDLPDDINWGSIIGTLGFGSAFGLADITYQGFLSPKETGAVAWGLGGSLILPTHTDKRFGSNKWSAGPAVVLFSTPGKWVLGLIAENIWSFAGDSEASDVNIFSAQIAINYKLTNGWYLTSAPLVSANWEADKNSRWTVPVGGGIGRIFKIDAKMAVAVDAGAYYNVEKPDPANDWYSQILVNLLFP